MLQLAVDRRGDIARDAEIVISSPRPLPSPRRAQRTQRRGKASASDSALSEHSDTVENICPDICPKRSDSPEICTVSQSARNARSPENDDLHWPHRDRLKSPSCRRSELLKAFDEREARIDTALAALGTLCDVRFEQRGEVRR